LSYLQFTVLVKASSNRLGQTSLTVDVLFRYIPPRPVKVGFAMLSPGLQKSKRSWQEIASEAFVEKDPAKLERLADELAEALYERDELQRVKSA
jgi:hypothetical protein